MSDNNPTSPPPAAKKSAAKAPTIGTADLARLTKMTRLAVPPHEIAAALQALNNILQMMNKLQEADVTDIDALSHVQFFGATMRLRDDKTTEGYPREELLAAAPQSDGEHFIVPKVIE